MYKNEAKSKVLSLTDGVNCWYYSNTKGSQEDSNPTIPVYTKLNRKSTSTNSICFISVTILLQYNCTLVDPENRAQNACFLEDHFAFLLPKYAIQCLLFIVAVT